VTTTRAIRIWLVIFIVCLALAGFTAFPLVAELNFASGVLHSLGVQHLLPSFVAWIDRVHTGVDATNTQYPFIFYGTDWLALAHLMIAIAGPIRGIPWGWELIDMSFGVIGIIPPIIVYRLIRRLERERVTEVMAPTDPTKPTKSQS
jgi:hypothetical protein